MTKSTLKTIDLLDNQSFHHYVGTALWSSIDDNGNPLDANYSYDDVDENSREVHRDECKKFIKTNYEIIANLLGDGYELSTIMHDFWLTRNHHGCGFWEDDKYPTRMGDMLTASAHIFNEAYPYVGDDGQVYLS